MTAINSLTPLGASPATEAKRNQETVLPDKPFGEMALALSGGGFRAASFSLGVISYLKRVYLESPDDPLLEHVSFLTSTSGGSITNAAYSVALSKGNFDFEKFYQGTREFMHGDDLLCEVFKLLENASHWPEKGHSAAKKDTVKKSANLINAFAKSYDKILFQGTTLSTYFNQRQPSHLKTVCFNATEFNNGVAFRFQTNGNPENVNTIGNYYLHFKNAEVAGKLKISDIVATSSCFPSGFEPLVYPNDYIHEGLNDVDQMVAAINYKNNNPLNEAEIKDQPFCMMDGGIVDNQGLGSMMMEDTFRRDNQKKKFDLLMVADVGSFYFDAFKMPENTKRWYSGFSLNSFRLFSLISVLIFGASLYSLIANWHKETGLLLLIPSGLISLIFLYLSQQFSGLKKDLQNDAVGSVILENLSFFKRLKLGIIQQMVAARLKSTITMASDLFLKQIRRQYFNEFYTLPAYKNRRLSCFIYEFSSKHRATRLSNLKKECDIFNEELMAVLDPGTLIIACADKASDMSTTLWFDPKTGDATRDAIIACGQFTLCYNLIKYIYRQELTQPEWRSNAQLQALKGRLLEDWKQFKTKPEFLV